MVRFSTLVSVGLMAGGGLAALQTLSRRQVVRAQDRTFSIVVELDDVIAVCVRVGLPLAELLPRLRAAGATRCTLIERTLAQAAEVGDGVVAFDGNLILGHEMHLAVTLAALEAQDQTFAYFAESRHQRGDWFIAKRRMPNVVIAHQYTAAQMIPED